MCVGVHVRKTDGSGEMLGRLRLKEHQLKAQGPVISNNKTFKTPKLWSDDGDLSEGQHS